MTVNANPMGRLTAERAGLIALVIGAAALVGHVAHIAPVVVWVGHDRVAATALEAFLLVGAGVALGVRPPRPWLATAPRWIALGILILSAWAALAIALDVNLGLDQPNWHEWLVDENPRVGRTGPVSVLALSSFALAFLLSQPTPGVVRARLVALLTAATIACGIIAVLGSFMTLDFLYTWHGVTRTNLGVAFGITSLGYGSYLRWRRMPWWRSTWQSTEVGAVTVVSVVTLASATLLAGLLAFAVMQGNLDEQARGAFAERADTQAIAIAALLADGVERADLVANAPGLAERFRNASAHPENSAARDQLAGAARNIVAHKFNAVRLIDTAGTTLTEFGAFEATPRLKLPLRAPYPAWVAYGNGFYLDVEVPIIAGGETLGTAVLQEQLPGLTRANDAATDWGDSGEAALCGPVADEMGCFPTRFMPKTFIVPRQRAGQPRAMSLALDGQAGVTKLLDHRQERTLAAYEPVGVTGLGFVMKMDLAEIYAPIRRGFELLLPLLALVVISAAALLRARLTPLFDEMVAAQRATEESERRFRAASETSLDAFLILETRRDAKREIVDFRVSYVNRNGERLLGRTRERIIGESVAKVLPTAVASAWLERYRRVVTTGRPSEAEVRLETPGYKARWIQQRVAQLGDGLALTVRDISDRKQAEEQLSQMPQTDALSGLPNRALFLDRLERAMLRHGRRGALCALMVVDVDGFMLINESSGYAAGDAVLKTYAERLKRALRAEDTVARIGGDAFALILEGLSSRQEALRSAEALLTVLRAPIDTPDRRLEVTASVGIAFYAGETASPEQLLERAWAAVAHVKRSGRNAYFAAEQPAAATGLASS